jgi:hypothetical protein
MHKIKEVLYEIKRTGWALLFVLLGVLLLSRSGREIMSQQLGVLIWKLLLLGTGIFVAHKARKQLFPYLDLSEHVNAPDWKEHSTANGLIFLGVAIITAAIILALCGGL